jgi:hypothetical protein
MAIKEDIEEYRRLESLRLEKQREAASLGKLQDAIEDRLMETVRAKGGKTKTLRTCGYTLAILLKRAAVKWKEEFVKMAGPAVAEELVQSAPQREVFSVTKA